MGFCIMGTPDQITTLFNKIDNLVDAQNQTNVSIENLRGDFKVLSEQMSHKIDDTDLVKHALECPNKKSGGFWSGMTAAQKTTIITSTLTGIGAAVVMILQNLQ